MPTRRMESPQVEIEDDGDDRVVMRFLIPGSKFGPVEIVYSHDEAETVADNLAEAVAFARGAA